MTEQEKEIEIGIKYLEKKKVIEELACIEEIKQIQNYADEYRYGNKQQ